MSVRVQYDRSTACRSANVMGVGKINIKQKQYSDEITIFHVNQNDGVQKKRIIKFPFC